jgi:hypothetical protein
MIYEKEPDGTFTFYTTADSPAVYVTKQEFELVCLEFISKVYGPWICSKHLDRELVGYVVGFNIPADDHDIEVVMRSARGKPRVFKTIDAAFNCLLHMNFNSAVVNYG